MTGRYLLAIDAGTGSCRAVLFTETGEQVAAGQREWTHLEPPGGTGRWTTCCGSICASVVARPSPCCN